jgi:hypothetical protein
VIVLFNLGIVFSGHINKCLEGPSRGSQKIYIENINIQTSKRLNKLYFQHNLYIYILNQCPKMFLKALLNIINQYSEVFECEPKTQ